MKFLKLIKLFVLGNIREEKFLTFLSIVGVALGIGLFTGVKVASDRAISSFEADIRGFNGPANYEISGSAGTDFPDAIYGKAVRIDEDSFPLLKTSAYVPRLKESIDLNGIYAVRSAKYLKLRRGRSYDFEGFYRTPNGVLVTRDFADRFSLKKGDALQALVYDGRYDLKIVDVLDSESLPANTVIMDLGNYQELFGKVGLLTRIDLIANQKTVNQIRDILPPGLSLDKKENIIQNQQSLVASFRYNLQFISLIAILVGMFLLYNTIFISVIKRRSEIGILRGLGAGKRTIVFLFSIQGFILGMVGSLLGILLGQVIAYFAVFAVQKTVSTMYSTISVSDYLIRPGDAFKALLLGLSVSLIASAVPSWESSRIRPNESSREGSFEGKYRKYKKIFFGAGLLAITSGGVAAYIDYTVMPFSFPFPAYAGILFILVGFAFISPSYLSGILKVVRRPVERAFRAIGKITLGDIRGNTYRFSVALMSVAISSALIISLVTLIFSFRNSLQDWISRNITADVYIKPASCTSNFCFYSLPEEMIQKVKGLPEVLAVNKFRTLRLDYKGKKIIAGFGDTGVERRFSPRKSYNMSQKSLDELGNKREVAVSSYLSIKYGLEPGGTLEIQTPSGPRTFTISESFSSYSTTSGFIYLDRRWLKELWGLDDATQLSIYLKKGTNVDQFVRKLNGMFSSRYSLEIMNNQVLRNKVLSIFNRTFSITYAIEFISILVSLIGVVNSLIALVFEQKREISIIRYLGASWKQIQQTLILSAGIIGLTGILLGTLIGPLMSLIFVKVINKISFGWEIHMGIPFIPLLVVNTVLFLATVGSGLLPSRIARKIDPKRFISFE